MTSQTLLTVEGTMKQMSDGQGADSTAVEGGRAALLTLRASLRGVVPIRLISVFFESMPMARATSDLEAAKALARVPKPVTCRADTQGDALQVDCEPLSGDILRSHEATVADLLSGMQWLHAYPEGQDLVLLRGRDEMVILPLRVFEQWCLDYGLPPGVAMTGRRPRKEEESKGVKYEFVLSRPEPFDR